MLSDLPAVEGAGVAAVVPAVEGAGVAAVVLAVEGAGVAAVVLAVEGAGVGAVVPFEEVLGAVEIAITKGTVVGVTLGKLGGDGEERVVGTE